MSNSPLASVTQISPNRSSPRNHKIDRITIHCFVGQVTARRGCEVFLPATKKASCNYVIGYDGSIGLCVDEGDRSWCSSSSANDNRAVTIETASDNRAPYAVTEKAYSALLDLVTDICKRNGIKALVWSTDKGDRMEHRNGCNMTVHRDYAAKACPGDYLYRLQGKIASEVNLRLKGGDDEMTQEQFDAMMEDYERRHALPVPDSTPVDWEKGGVDWATEGGLMAGDGTGNLMLHSPLTRAQFCVMLKRYHEIRDEL